MVEVKWTNNAIEDLKEISKYISRDSPKYARILTNQIFEIVKHLEQFPNLGRVVPEYEDSKIRELLYKNYRIIYKIKKEFLEIITIFHGSRKLK